MASDAPAAVPTGNTLDKYATANPVERRMMAGFFAAFDALVDRARPSRVLEVGAGEGEVAGRLRRRFPHLPLALLDLPDPDLQSRWTSAGLPGVVGSGTHLPFPDGAADLVLAIEVLEHVDDPPAVLRELVRASSGYLLVSVPREPVWRVGNMLRGRYLGDLGNTPGHVQHWSRRGFVQEVAAVAEVVEVRAPLPWTMVLARTG
ncbi:MAG: class I SAM-dependent methyltransferase [Actinomycetes bacterium]